MTNTFIFAAIDNDREALINGIKTLYNCHTVEISDQGRIAIADPQHFHWLGDDGLQRIERALKAGDI